MLYKSTRFLLLSMLILHSCGVKKDVYYANKNQSEKSNVENNTNNKKPKYELGKHHNNSEVPINNKPSSSAIVFKNLMKIDRKKFVETAKEYIGIPYLYGSLDPSKGLDCSGFVYNVFQRYQITPPRASYHWENEGITIPLHEARIGDILLFTGSNHTSGKIGHMGIITATHPHVQFIHSASGKKIGVINSDLKGYWEKHLVKCIQIFQ